MSNTHQIYTGVSLNPINLEKMYSFLQNPSHGALSTFIGRVRNLNLNKNVIGISYDVFESLAIATFQDICQKSKEKWGNDLGIYIEHFKGRLDIGGISIVIGMSSMHRSEAINACRYVIESIKHQAPIWKQEHYEGNSSEWVKGHSLCK